MGNESAITGPCFAAFDVSSAAPQDRFDAWRAMLPHVKDIDLLHRSRPFRARAVAYAGDDGGGMMHLHLDPTRTRFAEDCNDQFMLSLFVDGRSHVRQGRDRVDATNAGTGFSLTDSARPMETFMDSSLECIHLFLPRARVLRVLGPDPVGGRDAMRCLPDTPLGQILKAQLVATTQQALSLDAGSAAAAVHGAHQLAMAYLAQHTPAARRIDASPERDAYLFHAACRYIEMQLDTPGMTAERVAHAICCSRTQLYRVFAERELSVAAHVRDLRLSRSRILLRNAAMSVGDVAHYCGYGDLPAFSKAFKQRFGMSPGEWRRTSQVLRV